MVAYWFSLSVVIALLVLRYRKIPLLSPYGIFLAFQCLYNLIPLASVKVLGLDVDAINQQVFLSTTANIAFALAIGLFYKEYDFPQQPFVPKRRSRQYILACFPLFLITCVLCYFWGWHVFVQSLSQSGIALEGGGMRSVTAYAKHACIACYLYYLGRYRLDRYSMVLLAGLLVIVAVDGSRNNIFPVLVLTLMLWQSVKKIPTGKILTIFVICIAVLMGLRGVIIGATGLDTIAGPFVVEGAMAPYSSIQSIYAIQHMSSPPYLYGIGSMGTWEKGITGVIVGAFTPIGGFYYIAEAVADFGYYGPVIETFCFGWLLTRSEKWKRQRPLLYFAFISTVGIVFVKSQISNGVKLFIAVSFFLAIISLLHRLKMLLRQHSLKFDNALQ